MTDAELAILTLLNDGIQTDHALHAEIDSRGLRRWTAIGVSSMYYILEKLVKQGLVEAIHDHRPERAWRITQAGAGVLQTAIADLLSTPHTAQRGIEMGLANLHVLRPTQIHTALENYRHELTVRLTHAQAEIATEQKGTAKFATLAMYSHKIALMEAELTWIHNVINEYQSLNLQDPVIPTPEARPIPRIQQVVLPEDPDSIHKETTIQHVTSRAKVKPKPTAPPASAAPAPTNGSPAAPQTPNLPSITRPSSAQASSQPPAPPPPRPRRPDGG